jgi:Fic family protein
MFIPTLARDSEERLRDIEAFWNNGSLAVPFLIRIALIHYQMITLQPFKEGNGPLVRLLSLVLLNKAGFLDHPWLCLSDYLQQHQGIYYGCARQSLGKEETEMLKPFIQFQRVRPPPGKG